MFDNIKSIAVAVDAGGLLANEHLTFATKVDEQTGAILDRVRVAHDRGVTFTLTPGSETGRAAPGRVWVEVRGSLHKWSRGGLHNADQFTAGELLQTLTDFCHTYGIDPINTRLNNVEFGVNVSLPFPVRYILDNLITHKYQSFVRKTDSDFPYYQCQHRQYIVKVYDKGSLVFLGQTIDQIAGNGFGGLFLI